MPYRSRKSTSRGVMCSTKPCFFSVSFAMMRHSFLRADTKNRFPCSRPWPRPCAGTKGAFAVPPGLKRFQRVGKARLRRSFPTGPVSPPRKYRRSTRWARAALVFAHAFGSLWAFGPTAHRADASHRRLRRGRGNARWIRISFGGLRPSKPPRKGTVQPHHSG